MKESENLEEHTLENWLELLHKMMEMEFMQNKTLFLTMKLMEAEEDQVPFMMEELAKKPTEKQFQEIVDNKIEELHLREIYDE